MTLKTDIMKLKRLIQKCEELPGSIKLLGKSEADKAQEKFNNIRDDFMNIIWLYPDQRDNYLHLKDSSGLIYKDALELFLEISRDVISTIKSPDSIAINAGQPSIATSSNHKATCGDDDNQVNTDINFKCDQNKEKLRRVWVIHGRNKKLVEDVFAFLRAIGLDPIEWSEARAGTYISSPHITDILKTGFNYAQAFVVILTGDDEAKLCNEYIKPDDAPYEKRLTRQARQNVIFEAGMAFGRDPDRIVFIKQGNIRPFSNISGIHILELDNTPESRIDFASRLRSAGCDILDLTSRKDWLKIGDFALNVDVDQHK